MFLVQMVTKEEYGLTIMRKDREEGKALMTLPKLVDGESGGPGTFFLNLNSYLCRI